MYSIESKNGDLSIIISAPTADDVLYLHRRLHAPVICDAKKFSKEDIQRFSDAMATNQGVIFVEESGVGIVGIKSPQSSATSSRCTKG